MRQSRYFKILQVDYKKTQIKIIWSTTVKIIKQNIPQNTTEIYTHLITFKAVRNSRDVKTENLQPCVSRALTFHDISLNKNIRCFKNKHEFFILQLVIQKPRVVKIGCKMFGFIYSMLLPIYPGVLFKRRQCPLVNCSETNSHNKTKIACLTKFKQL